MEKRLHFSCEAALLTAILALVALSLTAAPAGPEAISISGQLHSTDGRVRDAVLVVELDGAHCLQAELREDGRFHMDLPLDSKVRLHFIQPGHLPKEVDTHNALLTPMAGRANRRIAFEVVLESDAERPGHHYHGPVGAIRFVNGTGTMKVIQDVRVVHAPGPGSGK